MQSSHLLCCHIFVLNNYLIVNVLVFVSLLSNNIIVFFPQKFSSFVHQDWIPS